MESSSSNNIFATQICKVTSWFNDDRSPLHNYRIGRDYWRRPIYITGEVHRDTLDQGTDLTEESEKWARTVGRPPLNGIFPDRACQIIPTKLGGNSFSSNLFTLNSSLDRSAWERDDQRVYDFVAGGSNRHALLNYAIEYNGTGDDDALRATPIHYHFLLHDDSTSTNTSIEGHFENTYPQPDYSHLNILYPSAS